MTVAGAVSRTRWMATAWAFVAMGCVGVAEELAGVALEGFSESCTSAMDAVEAGAREPDRTGERLLDAADEWSDVQAIWDSLQVPGDEDEWRVPLTDRMGASLEPWARIEMTDTVGHAWLELCAYYEGPGAPACFVGSTPSVRPAAAAGEPELSGCCRTTDEYGGAEVWLDLDGTWSDDSGALHLTVRSPDATCAGYWLMVAGAHPAW